MIGAQWLTLRVVESIIDKKRVPDQAGFVGLIHDGIKERSHLAIIAQYFSIGFAFPDRLRQESSI
jgi:hypothetical protein